MNRRSILAGIAGATVVGATTASAAPTPYTDNARQALTDLVEELAFPPGTDMLAVYESKQEIAQRLKGITGETVTERDPEQAVEHHAMKLKEAVQHLDPLGYDQNGVVEHDDGKCMIRTINGTMFMVKP